MLRTAVFNGEVPLFYEGGGSYYSNLSHEAFCASIHDCDGGSLLSYYYSYHIWYCFCDLYTMASTSVTNLMESHSGISFHSVLLALYIWCFYRYTRCSLHYTRCFEFEHYTRWFWHYIWATRNIIRGAFNIIRGVWDI